MPVTLQHADLPGHHAGLGRELRELWMEGRFCDVVLRSRDGTQHVAHKAVLAAASVFFKNLLGGPFLEANKVKQGEPVDIAASDAAVRGLLDYIYGGQPAVEVEASLELLRLSEAYDLPKLADTIVTAFLVSLDGKMALKVLVETQGLHKLKNACEEKVAKDFEGCSQHPDFQKLTVTQLARLLKREDLEVSREEAVLGGVFTWLKACKDRHVFLGTLLQHVDFRSLSFRNLTRLHSFASSIGPIGDDLQREVDEVMQMHKQGPNAVPTADHFRAKRRRLQNWSPDLGAYRQDCVREVFPVPCNALSWHDGALYGVDYSGNILRWKWNEDVFECVVGDGVRIDGINDFGSHCDLSVSPTGEMFVADFVNDRMLSFQHGCGTLVPGTGNLPHLRAAACSPNGVLHILNQDGKAVHKLADSQIQTVMASDKLPEDIQFQAGAMVVTKEEVIYLADGRRILRINPGDSHPRVVIEVADPEAELFDLSATESGTVYCGEQHHRKVFAFHPGNAACTEVLQCQAERYPVACLVHEQFLYVSIGMLNDLHSGGVYQYMLDPELLLEAL